MSFYWVILLKLLVYTKRVLLFVLRWITRPWSPECTDKMFLFPSRKIILECSILILFETQILYMDLFGWRNPLTLKFNLSPRLCGEWNQQRTPRTVSEWMSNLFAEILFSIDFLLAICSDNCDCVTFTIYCLTPARLMRLYSSFQPRFARLRVSGSLIKQSPSDVTFPTLQVRYNTTCLENMS